MALFTRSKRRNPIEICFGRKARTQSPVSSEESEYDEDTKMTTVVRLTLALKALIEIAVKQEHFKVF